MATAAEGGLGNDFLEVGLDPAAYEALEKDFQEVLFCPSLLFFCRSCKNWWENKVWRSSALSMKNSIELSKLPMSLRRDSSKGKLLSTIFLYFCLII
jgi:hypothetical protein